MASVVPENGFVDVQVNGYAGVDFSSPSLTLDDVARVCRELYERGTVAFCPTLITSPEKVYEENLPLLAAAIEEVGEGADILGIHLEGPFLRQESCGAHPEDLLRIPDVDMFRRWHELARGAICMMTLAPELPGAPEVMEQASARGVTVAIGHHLAECEDIERAVDCGATLCTHLGNGIVGRLPRHPNPLWTQLACDDLCASFVLDGHHVPREFVRVALRAKGMSRFVLVSDSVAAAGLGPGKYELGGHEAVLGQDGKMSLVHKESLAGSAAVMRDCVRQIHEWEGLGRDSLMQIARENPLRVLGLDDWF